MYEEMQSVNYTKTYIGWVDVFFSLSVSLYKTLRKPMWDRITAWLDYLVGLQDFHGYY